MSDPQLYKDIEILIEHIDHVSKEKIKQTLLNLLPEPCPNCHERQGTVMKYGRDLYKDQDCDDVLYTVCPKCQHVYYYSL
jgi:hypothetical protein